MVPAPYSGWVIRRPTGEFCAGRAAGVLNAAKDEILVNRDRSVEGWAVAEVRHTVSYSYLKEAP
jgi:hypothetical protein